MTITATDSDGAATTTTFELVVNNVAPTVNQDTATTDEEAQLVVAAPGVLDNDTDPGTDDLTVTVVNIGATIGTATVGADGSFTYDPAGQFEYLAVGEFTEDTFAYRVSDSDGAPSDWATVTITVNGVNDAPTAESDIATTDEDTSVVVEVLDNDTDQDASDILVVSAVDTTGTRGTVTNNGGTVTYDPNGQFEHLDIGDAEADTFSYTVSDGNGGSSTATVTVTITGVNDAPTLSVTPTTQTVQYSDAATVNISADDVDDSSLTVSTSFTYNGGAAQSGLPTGLAPVAGNCAVPTGVPPCTWSIDGEMLTAPGEYVITVVVDDGTVATSAQSTVMVTTEDARSFYVGPLFVSTSSVDDNDAVIELRATIQDITAASDDPATDAWPGDIRNATVTFTDESGTVLCAAPVDLVIAGDTSVGTAACDWVADIGNNDAYEFEVRVVVDGWYVDTTDTEVVIVVARPLSRNFITGGGYLVPTESAGVYAAADDTHLNYGFNVKFNKRGKNLQGRVTIIIRGEDGHKYKIKSNAMLSLGVDLDPDGDGNTENEPFYAEFESKANLTDVTDELNPQSLGGNLRLHMEMHDNGEPGDTDTIGFTLWAKNGTLLFSSYWSGVQTLEQVIAGGNLQVR
ncbi:MAG: tandem-95 repeat protein [Acidimicrobiia bacterium]|nr:tandem-95 repeat protein [Acidimicrobiia bacterium]